MTSDLFIAWAMQQPETEHFELIGGEVVAMAPERTAQALTKARAQSPSTSSRDVGSKLMDYFRPPSLCHCLLVRTEGRSIVHHARGKNGIILTRIVREGPIVLDPPGITLTDCLPSGVA
jgi:hypothetical protein